jgi:hypothetical protein
MFTRITVILGILGIIGGVFIAIASGIPTIGKVLAAPFCEELEEDNFGMTLTCEDSEGEERDLTALFGLGGSAVIAAGSLLLTGGLVGGLMATSAKLNRIVKHGEPAQGLILDMQGTGVRVNGQPMIKFRLQVNPDYEQPYEAETSRIIPFGMMGRLAIGMTVPVKYDPKKMQDVALDFDSMQLAPISYNMGMGSVMAAAPIASPQSSLSDKLRELEDSYKAGLINQQEYEDARQRIIGGV